MWRKKNIIFILLFLIISGAPLVSFAYTRIFYFRDTDYARESLFKYPSYVDILAPQSYMVDENGYISGGVDKKIVDFTKKKKIKIMPLLTNGKFDQKSYRAILENDSLQDSVIATLINIAKENKFYGWQIDFEQMDFSYREKFSNFIKKAHQEFEKNNLILSVAVIAQISENADDYKNNLWQKLIGVYDYKELGKNTDFISIMSYDDPESRGPVARISWWKEVMQFAMKNIPNEKISMGIPLYYWKWNDLSGKRVESGGRKGINNVFKKYKYKYYYSVQYETPYLKYKVDGKPYTLWYENNRSISKKIKLIKENKLYGFSAWALGLEIENIYSAIRK